MSRFTGALVVAGALAVQPLGAQDYRVRLDTRMQSVAFRGWTLDSVLASSVVAGPTGGFQSPDGIAVECDAGGTHCTFFRPGPEAASLPIMGSADLSVWGFGIPGLRVRAKLRALGDLENRSAWPGVRPALQLLDGYAEYVTAPLTVEAGRTHVTTRFGFRGFDGGRVEVRPLGRLFRLSAYGGWGLARGFELPVSSLELNPLGDPLLSQRQTVLGGWMAWSLPGFGGRVGYQREDDPRTDGTTMERAAVDAHLAVVPEVVLAGGVDYDLAVGEVGSADATLTYMRRGGNGRASVGARRYRPYFDLWSIWTAFSPIAYSAAHASAAVSPVGGVEMRVRGELYEFDDAAVSTPLVGAEHDGWRWSVSARITRVERLTLEAAAHQEHGPGSATLGYESQATFDATDVVALTASLAWMRRPLEYRFDDAKVWSYGLRADVRPTISDMRLYAELRRFDETRERPDAAELSWNQLRINLGATLTFGSGAGHRPLHPAILRIPDARRPQ